MKIPIIIECIIQKAMKCFKFLLINGIEDPTKTMQELNPDMNNKYWRSSNHYEWDCLAIAIYYGEVEIEGILEEKCIKKGSRKGHLEAAVLSYRNSITKEISIQMKMNGLNLNYGLLASVKNNNIKLGDFFINETCFHYGQIYKYPLHIAAMNNSKEMGQILISKGAEINAIDIISQIIIILY